MIKGSTFRIRVYRSTVVAAAAAAALVSTNAFMASSAFAEAPSTLQSATPGNQSATMSWTDSAPPSGYGVVDQQVEWRDVTANTAQQYVSVGSGPRHYTLTGLVNGDTYAINIFSSFSNGGGDESNTLDVVPNIQPTPPDAPTAVTASAGHTTAAVSWTAGAANGAPITGYTVTYTDTTTNANSGTYSPAGTATSATVPGLVPGDSYTFTVTATNSAGTSTASTSSNTITTTTAPGTPTDITATAVTATPGNPGAAVSWTAPVSGGTPITGYTITYTDTTTAANSGTYSPSGTATSATVPGLVDGDSYTFTVTATNAVGDGSVSAASNSLTASTVPAAPTGVTAVAGTDLATNDRATVSWTAPTDTGGLPLTGYTVAYTDTTTPGHNGSAPAGAGATSDTVTGLRPGDSYTFTVTAINADGGGTPSAATAGVTPVDAPGVPSGVHAVAGPGGSTGTVSWTVPNADGSAITGYTVQATDTSDNTGAGDVTAAAAGGASSATVAGLVPGDVYTFTVVATNAIGASAASHASNTVTPFTTAAAPTSVSATGGNGSAHVAWTAPAADGGSPVTSYVITYTDAAVPADSGTFPTAGAGVTTTVPGLIGGQQYTFTVAAVNAAGTGPASDPSAPLFVQAAPNAPTAVTAAAGPAGAQATVTWTTPSNSGGSPVTGYTITATDLTDPAGDATAGTGGNASSAAVTGLVPGDSYVFTVTATNAIGTSAASSPSAAVAPFTTPDAPSAVTAVGGNSSADLAWTAPTVTGGAPVTGYLIRYTDLTDPTGDGALTSTGTGTLATVPALANGDAYTFTVAAVNAAGPGPASVASTAVTPATTAGAPTQAAATADSSSADLTWVAPADTGGAPVTGYLITYTDHTDPTGNGTTTTAGAGRTATVTGLTPGDSYTFTVAAINTAGTGPVSLASIAVTPFTTAAAVTSVTAATGSDGAPVVTWAAPTTTGFTPVTGYTISYLDLTHPAGSGIYNPAGTATTATVDNLTPGDSYTFTVTATNAAGYSPASTPTAALTAYSPPGTPTAVTSAAVPGGATTTWTAPTMDGGSAVLSYFVLYTDTTTPANTFFDAVTAPATTDTVPLTPGDRYTVTVAASNTYGTGTPSTPTGAVVPFTVAAAPTAVTATAGDTTATLTWTAPTATGYTPITGYQVTARDTATGLITTTTTGPTPTALITGLTNGDPYEFTVAAVNAAGPSTPSAPSTAVTPQPIPLAVLTSTLPTRVAVDSTHTAVPFALTLNRPGAVTVTLMRGDTAVGGRLTIPAGPTTAVARTYVVLFPHTTALGDYTWVVTDPATSRVLATRATALKQASLLGLAATRSGAAITVHGSAKTVTMPDGTVVARAGQPIAVQRYSSTGWITLTTLTTDQLGHLTTTLRIPFRVGLRLLDPDTGTVFGTTSTSVIL